MGIINILKEVRQELKANVEEKYRCDNQKYFKEKISCYGVGTPIVRKIAKKYFKCHIHHVYIARKDVMFKPNFKMPMSYFNNFADNNSNAILPFGATITKPSQEWYDWFWFQERRRYLLKRKFIRNYIRRTPMFYPSILPKGRFFLNTEELATLFHLPSRIAAPPSVLKRVESKKAEAPWSLPTE